MTRDDLMARAAEILDAFIAGYFAAIEARLRHDVRVSGPEDENALDMVPAADAPWERTTVEELMSVYREAWRVERAQALCVIGRELSALGVG
jgi:hypothetical protein